MLANLSYMSLYNASLSGPVSVTLGQDLQNMTYLSLGMNQLVGCIPAGACPLLTGNAMLLLQLRVACCR